MHLRPPLPLLLAALSTLPLWVGCERREASTKTPLKAASPTPLVPAIPREISYDRDVRPILSDKCFHCHGTDSAKREANLRLDTPEGARAALKNDPKAHAIVPGHPEASHVWIRVNEKTGSDDLMPPAKSNKAPLNAEELATLKAWIEQGAPYENHWSFVAPEKPAPPEVKNAAWCRNEVDYFILAKLEKAGLAPSPETDKAALLRRVSLDLTGLPATPEETDAFLADTSADAYEKQVDRLLASKRFGERMAAYWCDAARYADTVGMHADEYHDYYHWRDWVISAHNANLPFDTFLTWCLAGDLVENPTPESQVASSFNRLNPVSTEGGAIDAELRVEYAADRVDVVGTSLLGLSLKCARCHDHKFDPISQEDFYSLFAYFNSIEESGLWGGGTRNTPIFGTSVLLPSPELAAQITEAGDKAAQLRGQLDKLREGSDPLPVLEKELQADIRFAKTQVVKTESSGGATLKVLADGSVLASGANPDRTVDTHTLRTEAQNLRIIRLEALADPSLPGKSVGRAPNGNAVLSHIEAEAVSIKDPSQKQTIHLLHAAADFAQEDGDYGVQNALRTGPDCWALGGHTQKQARVAYFLAEKPFGFPGGTEVRVKLHQESVHTQHAIGRARLSLAEAGPKAAAAVAAEWLYAGPFPAASYAEAFARTFGPEQDFEPAAVLEGGVLWQPRPDFTDESPHVLPANGNAGHYLLRRIELAAPAKAVLHVGSDDGLKVFLDGKQVFAHEAQRSVADGEDKIALDIPAGSHELMLKIANGGGEAGFSFRVEGLELSFPGAALALSPKRTPAQEARLKTLFVAADSPEAKVVRKDLEKAEVELKRLEAMQPRALVTKELATPTPTFVLSRGEYDKPDKTRPVTRRPLRIGGLSAEGLPANRLGLAQWMVSPANPLTARVMVNRYWQLVFVNGLCKTSEDFGLQGEYPPNLPLLDFLAVQFREDGWDVKKTLRRMVTSATYRQSSVIRTEAKAADPDNRLLAYFPRQRLGAEGVRDQALFVSGLLVEKIGGKAVKTYQPGGLWEVMALRGAPDNVTNYRQEHGEALYRRSLYTFWKRGCTPAQMVIFDGQDRGSCCVRRPTTNTPLQALMLWNDPQFLEAARLLATRTLGEATDTDARLALAFRRCTGRVAKESELAPLRTLLSESLARYQAAPKDAADLLASTGEYPLPKEGPAADPATLAAWTHVGCALFSLDETLVRD